MAPNDAGGLTSMVSVAAMAPNDVAGLTSMVSVAAMARSRGGNSDVTGASAPSATAADVVVVGSAAAASGRGDHGVMAAG